MQREEVVPQSLRSTVVNSLRRSTPATVFPIDDTLSEEPMERDEDSMALNFQHLQRDPVSFHDTLFDQVTSVSNGVVFPQTIDVFVDALSHPSVNEDNFNDAVMDILITMSTRPDVHHELETRGLVFGDSSELFHITAQVHNELAREINSMVDSSLTCGRVSCLSMTAATLAGIICVFSSGVCINPMIPVSQKVMQISGSSTAGFCCGYSSAASRRHILHSDIQTKHDYLDATDDFHDNLYSAIENKYKLKSIRNI